MFELTLASAPAYLVRRGLCPPVRAIEVAELTGGVSATVIAARIPSTGAAVVVKQALERLKVKDDWRAKQERTELEAAAMRLCDRLTPGRVPLVIDNDPSAHVVVMELLPDDAHNWQSEVAAGRAHAEVGRLGRGDARQPGMPGRKAIPPWPPRSPTSSRSSSSA